MKNNKNSYILINKYNFQHLQENQSYTSLTPFENNYSYGDSLTILPQQWNNNHSPNIWNSNLEPHSYYSSPPLPAPSQNSLQPSPNTFHNETESLDSEGTATDTQPDDDVDDFILSVISPGNEVVSTVQEVSQQNKTAENDLQLKITENASDIFKEWGLHAEAIKHLNECGVSIRVLDEMELTDIDELFPSISMFGQKIIFRSEITKWRATKVSFILQFNKNNNINLPLTIFRMFQLIIAPVL